MKKTNTPHIYAVKQGELLQDFTADKDGFVWFDEAGQLGLPKVYDSIEEASSQLKKYGDWLERNI